MGFALAGAPGPSCGGHALATGFVVRDHDELALVVPFPLHTLPSPLVVVGAAPLCWPSGDGCPRSLCGPEALGCCVGFLGNRELQRGHLGADSPRLALRLSLKAIESHTRLRCKLFTSFPS